MAFTSVVSTSEAFSHTFNGLSGDDYTVRVTESAGGSTSQKTVSDNLIQNLGTVSFFANSIYMDCVNRLTVYITSTPNIAASYELRTISGVVVKSEQTSNIFENVEPGTYRIYVKDICGQYYTMDYTVNTAILTHSIANKYIASTNCSTYLTTLHTYTMAGSAYTNAPYNYEVTFSNGTPSFNGTMNNSDAVIGKSHEIPIPEDGTSYTMTVTYTDACGIITSKNFEIAPPDKNINITINNALCGQYFTLNSSIRHLVFQ